jgi:2-(1,2-epoxy-1,2-dihydrophenyl)acetyl-CoA isomerase
MFFWNMVGALILMPVLALLETHCNGIEKMKYETIVFKKDNALARITLNRPEAANAMNLTMMQELADVSNRCEEDPDLRAVILTGAGRFFSAGGDLQSFAEDMDRLPQLLKELAMYLHTAVSRFARMKCPVIAALNGPCAGAGMSLACACDLVIAAESASFTMAYTAAGLSPDGSASWYLPRRIGELRARELMLTNRKLSAAEAVEWGLANRVVADNKLLDEVAGIANSLACGPTLSYGRVKSLLNDSFSHGLETQMEMEARGIVSSTRTKDAREGIDAFLAKRAPRFEGK